MLYQRLVTIADKKFDITGLQSQHTSGFSDNQVLWCSIPQYTVKIDPKQMKGTIKSQNCKQILYNGENQCLSCKDLIKVDSFRKRVIRNTASKSKVNDNRNKRANWRKSEQQISFSPLKKKKASVIQKISPDTKEKNC